MILPPSQREKIDKETFRQIISENWLVFKKKYPAYDNCQYDEVIEKMLNCGTESGGYSEYICLDCGNDVRRVCFSCKSSFCLSCSKVYVDNFVYQISKILHPGLNYRHIILTIPEQHRIYFYQDRHNSGLLSDFMRCGYKCLEEVVSSVKKQTLKIGTVVVVQTHGRSGQYNPHLHIIMTSGGINEDKQKWFDLNYFPYEVIHKKWQYHFFKMMKNRFMSKEMDNLINELWKKYPKGLVANVSRGDVPERSKGLAKYLARYLASPPISVKRIMKYDGKTVTYWYNDHESKGKKVETVDVYTFIGRMVQHILPKAFHRVRYYGLQATKTFSKWCDIIKEGLDRVGRAAKGVYQILLPKNYRERYKEVSGRDPMICKHCGEELSLCRVWHPKYGFIYDELENIKKGKYEKGDVDDGRDSLWPPAPILQVPLFQLQS